MPIASQNWDSLSSGATTAAGWTLYGTGSSFQVIAGGVANSAPNTLAILPGANGYFSAAYGTKDSNSGNVSVSAYFRWNATGLQEYCSGDVWARCSTTNLASTANGYFARIRMSLYGNDLSVYAQTGGGATDTALLTNGRPNAFAPGIYYLLNLICNGTTISVQVQRQDTGQWLDSSGVWVTDSTGATLAFTVTDSTVTGAGYAGVGFYAPVGAGGLVQTDDFLFQNLSVSGVCSAAPASSSSITASCTAATGGTPPYFYGFKSSPDGTTWSDLGSQQTGVAGVAPTPAVQTELSPGTYYYECDITDSASLDATTNSTSAILAALASGTCSVAQASSTAVSVACTGATGGIPPYSYQYRSSVDGVAWTNLGAQQTGVALGVAPAPSVQTILTAGSKYFYDCQITDSSTGSVTSNTASIIPLASGMTAMGSLLYRIDNTIYALPPGPVNSVLATSSSNPSSGLAWVSLFDHLTTSGDVNASGNVYIGGVVVASSGLGLFGVTPPVSKPVFPGTAAGTDAAVINALVTLLAAYGFCAPS